MRPDLDPAVREIIAKTAEQHLADAAKLRAEIEQNEDRLDDGDDLDGFFPTAFDVAVITVLTILAAVTGIATVVGAFRFFGA